MDRCRECIRKVDRSQPTECPNCKAIALMSRLEGATMLIHCSECGYDVAGASFFAPCDVDHTRYTITIHHAEKNSYVKLAALFGLNVVQLRDTLNKNGACSKTIGFHEAIEALEILEDIGEAYTMTPDLMAEYPELKECKYR